MKKPQKKFQEEYKPTIKQRIFSLFKLYFCYPFKISKMYRIYNFGITELIAVKNEPKKTGEDDKYYRNFQKSYSKLVYSLIFLPMVIGILISSIFIYMDKSKYKLSYEKLTSPMTQESLFAKTKEIFSRSSYFISNSPIKTSHYFPFFLFYTVSILGANFLSKNPVFKRQESMANQLVALGCVDINGNPWRLIWTEEAMLFISFGADPKKLAQRTEFWTTINFPPSTPKQSKKDLNKFIVKRRNEQNENLIFKLGDDNEPTGS